MKQFHADTEREEAYYVGLMNSVGYRNKDLDKPVIGIVNSWNEVNPGHRPLRELAQFVKEGVWAGGGTPAEFNVPAPCDGIAQIRGMNPPPPRDLIAGSAEAMVHSHAFERLVSCFLHTNYPESDGRGVTRPPSIVQPPGPCY
jgi:dihydroxy-acid dehydratase